MSVPERLFESATQLQEVFVTLCIFFPGVTPMSRSSSPRPSYHDDACDVKCMSVDSFLAQMTIELECRGRLALVLARMLSCFQSVSRESDTDRTCRYLHNNMLTSVPERLFEHATQLQIVFVTLCILSLRCHTDESIILPSVIMS